jgi:hypothetical protein
MAGIDLEKSRQVYGIPESHSPVTAIAIGYAADPATSDPELAERDRMARRRKPLGEFVYRAVWGQSAFENS